MRAVLEIDRGDGWEELEDFQGSEREAFAWACGKIDEEGPLYRIWCGDRPFPPFRLADVRALLRRRQEVLN